MRTQRKVTTDTTGTVLGVWAHPDDEAYLSAGLMATARDRDERVVCVTATRGEQGTPDPERWTPERLARLREREITASLASLGVTEHHWLDHADGTLHNVPVDVGTSQVQALIEEVSPDLIVTFGSDGVTGHTDHQTISRWTTSAWVRSGTPCPLLYATMTDDFVERNADLHAAIGAFEEGYPVATKAEQVSLAVTLDDDLADRKLVALRAQASQTSGLIEAMGEDAYRQWITTESFRRPTRNEILVALGIDDADFATHPATFVLPIGDDQAPAA